MKKTEIFDKKAVEFIAKKVSNMSSDIRKTLDFCRTVVKEHIKSGERRLIKIYDVKRVFDRSRCNPFIQFIKACTNVTKICIMSFYNEIVHKQKKAVSGSGVFTRFSNILKVEDYPRFSYKEFRLIVDQLYNVGFLVIKGTALVAKRDTRADKRTDYMVANDFVRTVKNCDNGDMVINVKFELDDIAFALKDFDLWAKYGNISDAQREASDD